MKYSLRSLMIVGAVVGLLLPALGGGYCILREQGEMIRDAYCVDWASAMIVQFMDDNDGQYPREWNDLRLPFEKISDKSFAFEEIRSRVEINFSANLLNQRDDGLRPFVQLKSGRGVSWGSPEPNERIRARIAQGKPTSP